MQFVFIMDNRYMICTGNGSIEVIEILRLKNKSFWYRVKRGSDVPEFHLMNDQREVP